MAPLISALPYQRADVINITKEEFTAMNSVNIQVIHEEEPPEQIVQNIQDESVVAENIEQLKQLKVQEMKNQCRQTIYDGIWLEDKKYSYKLEDQQNLGELIMYKDNVLYHADGEEYHMFTHDEIMQIYVSQQINKAQNLLYCSQLEKYINTLSSFDEIVAVFYGTELPDPYLSKFNELFDSAYKMWMEVYYGND